MKLTRLITVLLLLVPQVILAASWQWIAPQRVHNLIREGSSLWIVDVRSPSTFEQGHIEGAMNVPAELLKIKKLPKAKIIVLADDSLGLRNARNGAETLAKKGFEKVFILEGGIPAWQGEALPVTGMNIDNLRPVMWDDLSWARANNIPLRLYDLRSKEERSKGPMEGTRELAGATLAERLKALTAELRAAPAAKGLAKRLEKSLLVVLVLPTTPQPLDAVHKVLQNLSGDFRYLDGAYPLWAAREKQNPLPGPDVCPTCPGGRAKK